MLSRRLILLFCFISTAASHGHAKDAEGIRERQEPNVFSMKSPMGITDLQVTMTKAVPGVSFPVYADVPQTDFDCSHMEGPGYFADMDTDCQAFRRCTPAGQMFSYLCPNATIFNQLMLVCDWWWNVDCARAKEFYMYANKRLGQRDMPLHDDLPL